MLNNLPRKQRDKINISGNMWEQVTNVSTLGKKTLREKFYDIKIYWQTWRRLSWREK